jgi:hypothetical protein
MEDITNLPNETDREAQEPRKGSEEIVYPSYDFDHSPAQDSDYGPSLI